MQYIRPFTTITKDDVAVAGGKGASLGEMTNAGFPVPPGFVITASAFERFLQELPRSEDIAAQLKQVNLQDTNSVDHASQVIRDIIHDCPMQKDLADEIIQAHAALGAEFVAVRSSATAEDSAIASWAGELETYLNTIQEQLIENVKKCWASLYTTRAIFYRKQNKLEDATIHVAVVVQQMVDSDVAGVCFTVHPVTEDRNQLIIEAGFGLGEAVVSGQITPDSYIVAKDTTTLIDKYISTQTMKIVRNAKRKNEQVTLQEPEASQQKITEEQVEQLTALAIRIEKHYGFPVDIEWAIHNNGLFITQVRPITTLKK